MNTPDPLIDIPTTQYYFDTFVVGAHHSLPHMVADLMKRKSLAQSAISTRTSDIKKKDYEKLIALIDAKLNTLNIDEVEDLELAEPTYWVNELARRAAIEINTYGRIRPETLTLLLCIEEEDFGTVMRIASGITARLKLITDFAEKLAAPIPPNMPVKE